MKRLLCIISNMNAGGSETFLMKLYREIDRSGYQMDFCINVYEKCFYETEIERLGGKVFRIPSHKEYLLKHDFLLKGIIKNEKYQYVLAVSDSTTCYYDIMIAKKMGVLRTCVRSCNSSTGNAVCDKIIQKLFRIFCQKYVDVFFAPSQMAASFLFGPKARYIYLPNAINYDDYSFSVEGRQKIRNQYGCSDDTVIIGHIGRFVPQKNHARLIDVFKSYCTKHQDARLLMIGTGYLQESISHKIDCEGISDKVIIVGTRKDVAPYLSAMDVFLFPSFYEGMPNAVIEAQANGLPCILSNSITEEVNITNTVSFVSLSDNSDTWVQAIENALNGGRTDTRSLFADNRYSIRDVSKLFVESVFGTMSK